MGAQLVEGAVGTAAGVLTYSLICMLSSCLLIWLLWVHRERYSFVSFIAWFALLSTLTSIIQQIHTIVDWRDVKVEQWENEILHLGSPEVAVAGPSVGLDLVLFYIQYYAYNVTALLVLFWAAALIQSIFAFSSLEAFKAVRNRANNITKVVAILLPAALISMLQAKPIKSSFVAFLLVANINLLISLTVGSILLLITLGKYIHTRRQFLSWNVQYGNSTNTTASRGLSSAQGLRIGLGRRHSIYDQWLMLRFTIAFIMLGIFEMTTILFQVASINSNSSLETIGSSPNLTVEKAQTDFLLFMPGVSISLLTFVVFGTTKPFRETMKCTFIPRRFLKDNKIGPVVMPYLSNSRKTNTASRMSEEEIYSPAGESGSAIRLQEIYQQHESRKQGEEDEWPILASTTRVNGNNV